MGDGHLSEDDLRVLRTRLRERLQELQLARRPILPEERRAADAVLWTWERAQRRTRARDNVSRFPLRSVRLEGTRGGGDAVRAGVDTASPAGATSVLDAMFGPSAIPDEDPLPVVPTEAEPDDAGEGPLPRTAEYLAELARTPTTAPLAPVGEPVDLPFETEPDWTGVRRWRGALDVRRMSPADAQDHRRLLYKELRVGALRVHACASEVRLLTPVSVVRSITGKLRLVHDLRPLNCRLRQAGVRYESVRDAVALRGRVASKADLASAFKHVAVTDEAAGFMAFQVGDVVLSWRRLPFGMSWSPQLFQAALQPVIDEARRMGLRIVTYVDDVYIVADGRDELDADMLRLLQLLGAHGWRVAPDKAYAIAHTRVTFLGLSITPATGRIAVPQSKANKLAALCRDALGDGGRHVRVAARKLEKVCGLLAFFIVAVPTVGLAWRAMHGALAEAHLTPGRHVWLRGGLAAELRFWAQEAAGLPGWPSLPSRGELPGDEFGLATDASGDGLGALWWPGRGETPDLARWDGRGDLGGFVARAWGLREAESGMASAVRELLALESALADKFAPGEATRRPLGDLSAVGAAQVAQGSEIRRQGDGDPGEGIHEGSAARLTDGVCQAGGAAGAVSRDSSSPTVVVRWFSDSTAAVCALKKWRSVSDEVTAVLLRILRLVHRHRIVLRPEWVSRRLGWMPAADYLSRVVGRRAQAEWSVEPEEFERACGELRVRPTLDAFATRHNARCRAFRSRGAESGGRIDAFGAPWHRVTYAFPPFQLCRAAVSHWESFGRPGDSLLLLTRDTHQPTGRIRVLRELRMHPTARLLGIDGRRFHSPPPDGLRWVLLRLN